LSTVRDTEEVTQKSYKGALMLKKLYQKIGKWLFAFQPELAYKTCTYMCVNSYK
jgi:hypothetical protein